MLVLAKGAAVIGEAGAARATGLFAGVLMLCFIVPVVLALVFDALSDAFESWPACNYRDGDECEIWAGCGRYRCAGPNCPYPESDRLT